jgi:hypothetical protein
MVFFPASLWYGALDNLKLLLPKCFEMFNDFREAVLEQLW